MSVVYSTAWAMPSRWTFTVKPIGAFVRRHVQHCRTIVDPFAGRSHIATHRNDLVGGMDAIQWCAALRREHGDGWADAVIFDPPYSPRQIAESYRCAGHRATEEDTQQARLYRLVREPLAAMLLPGGVALSFGWQSSGFGTAWPVLEILLVQHGGGHNDTICVAQTRPLVAQMTLEVSA